MLSSLELLGGCETTEDTSSSVETSVPTSLKLDPKAFLGSTPCSDRPGAMQSYVARLVDDDAKPKTKLVSPPTPCSQAITFHEIACDAGAGCPLQVLDGHAYRIDAIDGYTQEASALEPRASKPSSDDMTMLNRGDGGTAEPRWTGATCPPPPADAGADAGVAPSAVIARHDERVPFVDCSSLTLKGDPDKAAIVVDPRASLGLLACASAAGGVVDHFTVTPQDPSLPSSPVDLPCETGTATYDESVAAGTNYTFSVMAYRRGIALPSFSTTCTAKAAAHVTVVANCGVLMPVPPP